MPGLFWTAIFFLVVGVAAGILWVVLRRKAKAAQVQADEIARKREEETKRQAQERTSAPVYARSTVIDDDGELAKSQSHAKMLRLSRRTAGCVAISTLALGVVLVVSSSAYTVPVRNVGIVTSFHKPTGETTGSGLNWVAPWKRIADWDASIQTASNLGGWSQDGKTCDGSTLVRTANSATACVENKVRWQAKPESSPKLFTDYKGDFGNMKANLFDTELQNALNEVFAGYNPLSRLDAETGDVKFDLAEQADKLKVSLQERIGDDIVIHAVSIPLIHHDQKTQANIDAFQTKVSEGRNLDQDKVNADKRKAVADKLSVINRELFCLQIVEDKGGEPGFCLGGGNPVQNTSK